MNTKPIYEICLDLLQQSLARSQSVAEESLSIHVAESEMKIAGALYNAARSLMTYNAATHELMDHETCIQAHKMIKAFWK